jgi:magnesium chelatase family protein
MRESRRAVRGTTRAFAGRMPSIQAATSISGEPLGIGSVAASVVVGIEAQPIEIEVCSSRGPSSFQMVGLAEAAVREARVRVQSALSGLGVLIDEYALTVNLAPADLRKTGATLDLALAVGVLVAIGRIPPHACARTLLLGELALDGSLRPVRGLLPQLESARQRGLAAAIVPADNAREGGIVQSFDVRLARSLEQVVSHLSGGRKLESAPRTVFVPSGIAVEGDLADVRGQGSARRALEIAAAGSHNLLMMGPPGGGKTLLSRLLPGILPALTFEEAVDCTAIHSVAGLLPPEQGIVSGRPFRAPHHSVSEAGLVGGGEVPRPGEVSLAHHGVLFLDELAEFRRSALEALRFASPGPGRARTSRRDRSWSAPSIRVPAATTAIRAATAAARKRPGAVTPRACPALCWTASISTSPFRPWKLRRSRAGRAPNRPPPCASASCARARSSANAAARSACPRRSTPRCRRATWKKSWSSIKKRAICSKRR